MKIFFDNYCPRTMLLLGAALSGGDAMELARQMVSTVETTQETEGETSERE